MQNLCRPLQVGPSEKSVLMCLADSASDNGHCFLLVSTLELFTCLGERTVRRAVASLVERGYVRLELRQGRSSVYWLIPEAIDAGILPMHRRSLTPATQAPPPAKLAPTPANAAPITMSYPCLTPHKQESVCETDFETVWKAYPRHACKAEALDHWRKLANEPRLLSRMLAWIAAQKLTDQWARGVVPHLKTVLNGRRFEDAPPIAESGSAAGCAVCGGQWSVTFEGGKYCRDHNPVRHAA